MIATEQIDEYLPTTDILVMVLPTSDSTFKALDAHKLQLLPKRAYLINVGRGTTVDEDALVAALNSGSIAGAALDVTAIEPLLRFAPVGCEEYRDYPTCCRWAPRKSGGTDRPQYSCFPHRCC